MFGWQGTEVPRMFAVILDENVVPDLQDVGVVGIDQMSRFTSANTVKVNFTATISPITTDPGLELTCMDHMVQ
jgi:hypothetical protein